MADASIDDDALLFEHHCKACGHRGDLVPAGTGEPGWDDPPRIGAWGLVTPRFCPQCGVEGDLRIHLILDCARHRYWWRITREAKNQSKAEPNGERKGEAETEEPA